MRKHDYDYDDDYDYKIYIIYGDNISGGVHGCRFIVVAESLQDAKVQIMKYLYENKWELKPKWKLDDTYTECFDIEPKIINFDSGDCC